MKTGIVLFTALFFSQFLAVRDLGAESLRGALKGELIPDSPGLTVGLEDLVQISLPAATRFTRALEIEVQIPRELLPYRSSFAVYVYQNFVPAKNLIPAQGDRITLEVLPPASKFYLEVPLIAKAGLKAAVDTAVVKAGLPEKTFPLCLSILPLDKGLPADVQKTQFLIKTRFLNSNLGGLNLLTPSISTDQRKLLRITANGVVQPSEGPLLLEPGLYTLELSLPGYTTEVVNSAVAQAKMADVTVALEEENPEVVFEAPEGSTVYLDGKRLAWTPLTVFPVEKGVHTVQFVVGNSQVTDDFEITKGGRHKVSLVMQIAVTDSP